MLDFGANSSLWGPYRIKKTYPPVIAAKIDLLDNAFYPDGAGNNPAIFPLIDTIHP